MHRYAALLSWFLAGAAGVLTLVGQSQSGECFEGDPIPDCPNAGPLWEWGYVLAFVALVSGLAAVVFTVLWLLSKRRARRSTLDS